jgi:hypothetical protein
MQENAPAKNNLQSVNSRQSADRRQRQKEARQLAAEGYDPPRIAREMDVSLRQVYRYLSRTGYGADG